jgi:hypothetical protein
MAESNIPIPDPSDKTVMAIEAAVKTLSAVIEAKTSSARYEAALDIDRRMGQLTSELATRFDASLAALNTKIDERSKVPWPAWSAAIAAITVIGTLAYWPISQKQQDLTNQISNLEHVVVPRAEHEEQWHAIDAQFKNLQDRVSLDVTNLQREIDEINKERNARPSTAH